MVCYRWNHEKNRKLQRDRGVSFEQAVVSIEHDGLLDVIQHPNAARYPNQQVLIVRIRDYVYAVPFVADGDVCFLKTIIPSRKLTRLYRGEDS